MEVSTNIKPLWLFVKFCVGSGIPQDIHPQLKVAVEAIKTAIKRYCSSYISRKVIL
jgi:hypothetical protein